MDIILNIVGALLAIISAAVAGWLYNRTFKSKPSTSGGIAETRAEVNTDSRKSSKNNVIRIVVVDDESVVRDGVVAILSYQSDFEVVGEAVNGMDAVSLVEKAKPDIVLLDMVMPKMDGLSAIPKIIKVSPNTRILVLTSFAESDRVYQAIKAGAMGYLLKDATRAQLLQAVRDLAHGQASIQPSIALNVINEIDHPSELLYNSEPLTPRELETLRLIARGLSNSEIAEKLVVHERTVAKYVGNILDKLHLSNRTQAALYAIREGLTESNK